MPQLLLTFILFNIPIVLLIYIVYKNDCKDIGKENLAIPIEERLGYLFLYESIIILCYLAQNKIPTN